MGGDFSSQFIDWGHGAILPDTTAHEGSLNTKFVELNFNYGFSENWNIETVFSIGSRSMDFRGDQNSVHHRNESKTGFGDTKITLRYLSSNVSFGPGTRLFFGGGVIIPSDNVIKENPFRLGQEDEIHSHFDLSEGAFKILGEIQYFKRDKSPIVKGGILKYTTAIKENKYSFTPGYQLDGLAMVYWQTKEIFKGIPQFSLIGQKRGVNVWEGNNAPNSGGFVILGEIGLMWNFDPHHFTFSFRIPIYQKLNMVQEESSIENHADMWGFSLSYRTVLSFGDD